MKKQDTKMKTKDIITIAIFSLLFAICLFVAGGLLGIIPITFIFYAAPSGVLFGIIYLYLRVKVPKRGAVILQGVLTAGLYWLIGNPWVVPAIIMFFALCAELASTIRNHQSFWGNAVSYILFSFGVWAGKMAPMLISAKEYKEYAIRTGMGAEYTDQLLSYLQPAVIGTAALATVIGCLVGALIARGLMKKHFQKMGVI